ncbi:hypothetical protein ONA91_29245 [Micromonospora sp. DR5-3]|uniref:hypothetical protein n=1 Tax=unclassified Micromonospora TaxID=2617518 RepID=UPI0011DB680B|nr:MULTISPECIES: hypothetical protein [unclassified Micromonospora]MCW3818531.1 hypothetical protein [Micromonospora sp. DR5-3]TYC20296.1 hypothetical protein FXF52_32155 [Micromonospora sp. MP36]
MAWAHRENDRRRRAYDAEVEAWRRREEQLVRLRIEATGFLGCTQPRTGLPVELDDDEVLYRVLPSAELVEAEARHIAGLPPPGLALGATLVESSGPALPKGLRVVDTGMAVVTDRRVAFGGRSGRREWTYRELLGPGHHPEVPVTLLHTADGRRPAGLQVPGTATVNFRFYLTLAFAAASGQRAAVAPQVDALLAAHRAVRPAPPPPVAPQDAPVALLPPERMAAAAAVVVAVAFAALTTGAVTPGPADVPYRAQPGASGMAPVEEPNGTVEVFPSPSARPAAPGTGPVPSPAAVSVALTTTETPEATRPAPRTTSGRPRPAPPAARVTRTPPAGQPAPTTAAPPAAPPPSSAAPTPAPAPSSEPPPADPPVVSVCLDPLRLPLLDSLLCPSAGS